MCKCENVKTQKYENVKIWKGQNVKITKNIRMWKLNWKKYTNGKMKNFGNGKI